MEYTILIVDDDSNLLEGMRRVLHGVGFRIRCAQTGDEALRLLREDRIHLVISDQVMPGLSGTEFLQQVHRLFPDVVLFLLTGHATVDMIIEALNKANVERVFLKPCNLDELAAGINETLQKHTLVAQALKMIEEAGWAKESIRQKPASKSQENDVSFYGKSNTDFTLEEMPFGWDTLIRRIETLMQDKPSGSRPIPMNGSKSGEYDL